MKRMIIVLLVIFMSSNIVFANGNESMSEEEQQQYLKKVVSGEIKVEDPYERILAAIHITDLDFILTYLEYGDNTDIKREFINRLYKIGDDSKVVPILIKVGGTDIDLVIRNFIAGCLIKRGYEKESLEILEYLIENGYVTTGYINLKDTKTKTKAKDFLYMILRDNKKSKVARASALFILSMKEYGLEKIDDHEELIIAAIKTNNALFIDTLLTGMRLGIVIENENILKFIDEALESTKLINKHTWWEYRRK